MRRSEQSKQSEVLYVSAGMRMERILRPPYWASESTTCSLCHRKVVSIRPSPETLGLIEMPSFCIEAGEHAEWDQVTKLDLHTEVKTTF